MPTSLNPNNQIKMTTTNTTLSIGLLTRVSFRKFNPSKKNRKAVEEYSAKHGVERSMLTSNIRLIPKRFTDPLQRIESDCRKIVEQLTLPWEDRGNRLLPSKMVAKYQDEMRAARYRWDKAVDAFVGEWSSIVEEAKRELAGDFFRYAGHYPSSDQVRSRFQMLTTFMPMPDNDKLATELREEMEEVFHDRIEDASSELRTRLVEKLEHLASKCREAGSEGSRFYSSNVDNVLELCDLIPDMLIKDDDNLLASVQNAKDALSGIDADVIKSSPIVAEEVRQKATDIVNSLI